jgi:hypothetical protein
MCFTGRLFLGMKTLGNSTGSGLKHGQVSFGTNFVEPQDIKASIIGFDLEISVVAPIPLIQVHARPQESHLLGRYR